MRIKIIAAAIIGMFIIFLSYYELCKIKERRFDKIVGQYPNLSERIFLEKMGKPNSIIVGDTCLPGQRCYEYYGFLKKNEICFDSVGELVSSGSGVRNRLFEWFGYANGMVTICTQNDEK